MFDIARVNLVLPVYHSVTNAQVLGAGVWMLYSCVSAFNMAIAIRNPSPLRSGIADA